MEVGKIKGMRRVLLIALAVLLFAAASLPATEIIGISSSYYECIEKLYLLEGRLLSGTKPYERGKALQCLKALDYDSLSPYGKKLYDEALGCLGEGKAILGEDNLFFKSEIRLAIDGFAHTNTNEYSDKFFVDGYPSGTEAYSAKTEYRRYNFNYGWWEEREPFLDYDMLLDSSWGLSIFFQLTARTTVHTYDGFGTGHVESNVPMVSSFRHASFEDFNMNFPYRAYVAYSKGGVVLELGREQYDWGMGKTGNLIIDGHFPYHSGISLSLSGKAFSYTFLFSSLPYTGSYIEHDENGKPVKNGDGSYKYNLNYDQRTNPYEGIKAFLGHRLEWIGLGSKLRVALSECIIYQNDSGVLDFQVFNPVMFYHNYYTAGNSNSILSLESDFAFSSGSDIRLAFVIDDINISGEAEWQPDAIALQVGFDSIREWKRGIFSTTVEATFLSPFMYRRNDSVSTPTIPVSFITAVRNQRSKYGSWDLDTIGYPLGGDVFSFYCAAEFESVGSWSVQIEAEFITRGPFSLIEYAMSPEDVNDNRSDVDEESVYISLSGEKQMGNGVSIGGSITPTWTDSRLSENGNNISDIQFFLYYKWKR